MARTKIAWCDKVWNPVTGCTKISEGCRNCYAERMAKRLQAMGQPRYANGFKVVCHSDALDMPFRWSKPVRIFVNSMSDLFHERVPDDFIFRVFQIMRQAKQHTFMILTKRPDRMERFCNLNSNTPLPNVWLGISVENQKAADERIPLLLRTPAVIRFLSCEPLLEPIDLKFEGTWTDGRNSRSDNIHWIIVGGESGPSCRPMRLNWASDIRRVCQAIGIPFFFKQTGGLHHGSDLLDGIEYKQFPKL